MVLNLRVLKEMNKNPIISGFTTNPTLMRLAGVTDYEKFSRDVIEIIGDKPISLEVFADDFETMERQALKIASWGKNVYVKIPIMNTKSELSFNLIKKLSDQNVKLNVTVMTPIKLKI